MALAALDDWAHEFNWNEEIELFGLWYPRWHAYSLFGVVAVVAFTGIWFLLLPSLIYLFEWFFAGYAWVTGVGYAGIALNLYTFAMFVLDKIRARQGGWRVPEKTLLNCALVGGWPGALLAMLIMQHKTRKVSFLLPMAACVVGNSCSMLLLSSVVTYIWKGVLLL